MEFTRHISPEDLSGYALKALEADETRSVEAHLAGCAECRALLAGYAQVSDGLLFAVPHKTAPPQLRTRLAESIAAGKPVVAPARPRFRMSFFQTALALTSAALLIAVILLAGQVRSLQVQQAALIQSLQKDRTVLALVSEAGVTLVPVQSGQITGSLAIGSDGRAAAMVLQGLPDLDNAHTFQVWLIPASGDPQSAGLFRRQTDQPVTTLSMVSPIPLKDYAAVGISIEPRAGSKAPTTQPILVVNL
jgi:anti-sigma-K factor RskA